MWFSLSQITSQSKFKSELWSKRHRSVKGSLSCLPGFAPLYVRMNVGLFPPTKSAVQILHTERKRGQLLPPGQRKPLVRSPQLCRQQQPTLQKPLRRSERALLHAANWIDASTMSDVQWHRSKLLQNGVGLDFKDANADSPSSPNRKWALNTATLVCDRKGSTIFFNFSAFSMLRIQMTGIGLRHA